VRFLANENFPVDAIEALRGRGHDVAWVLADSPGIADAKVLARAQAEERILLTFYKDFGELAFRAGLPSSSGVVLFRISAQYPAQVTRVSLAALDSRTDWAGNFAVIEDDQIRITPLPEKR